MTNRALTEAERRALAYISPDAEVTGDVVLRLLAEHAALLAVARAAKHARQIWPESTPVALTDALSTPLVKDMLEQGK